MKKILVSLLVFLLCFNVVGAAGFRENGNVINFETPVSQNETTIEWSKDFTEGWDNVSDLLVINDSVYFTTGTLQELIQLDLDGNVVKRVSLDAYLGYNVNITNDANNIYVPLGDNRIQAIDINTFETVWISAVADGLIQSKLTVNDGYLYFGTYDWSGTIGSYYAIDLNDTSTTSKDFAWQYTSSNNYKGYNLAQAVVYNDVLYFAGSDGQLVAHALDSATVYDKIDLVGGVSSALALYDNQLYFATNAGYIYNVELNADSTFGVVSSQLLSTDSGARGNSTPTLFDNKLYVGLGFGFGNPGKICVVDATTLNVIYSVDVDADVTSSPLVSNIDGKTVAYFTVNNTPGGVKALIDGETSGEVVDIYVPVGDANNYCMSTLVADNYGSLYHTNDSGYITKISKTSSIDTLTASNVTINGQFDASTVLNVTNITDINLNLKQYYIYKFETLVNDVITDLNQKLTVNITIPTELDDTNLVVGYLDDNNEIVELEYTYNNRIITIETTSLPMIVVGDQSTEIVVPTTPDPDPNVNHQVESNVPLTVDTTTNIYLYLMVFVSVAGVALYTKKTSI